MLSTGFSACCVTWSLSFMLIWLLPVYLLMVQDFPRARLIHPVDLIGWAAMLTMRLVLPIGSSPAWRSIASQTISMLSSILRVPALSSVRKLAGSERIGISISENAIQALVSTVD